MEEARDRPEELTQSRLAALRRRRRVEVGRLAAELDARNAELTALQDSLRAFKARYAQTVGALLSELSEVEAEIRRAEARSGWKRRATDQKSLRSPAFPPCEEERA